MNHTYRISSRSIPIACRITCISFIVCQNLGETPLCKALHTVWHNNGTPVHHCQLFLFRGTKNIDYYSDRSIAAICFLSIECITETVNTPYSICDTGGHALLSSERYWRFDPSDATRRPLVQGVLLQWLWCSRHLAVGRAFVARETLSVCSVHCIHLTDQGGLKNKTLNILDSSWIPTATSHCFGDLISSRSVAPSTFCEQSPKNPLEQEPHPNMGTGQDAALRKHPCPHGCRRPSSDT